MLYTIAVSRGGGPLKLSDSYVDHDHKVTAYSKAWMMEAANELNVFAFRIQSDARYFAVPTPTITGE